MEKEYKVSFDDAKKLNLNSETIFPDESGIYLIRETSMNENGYWSPTLVYIGKAENLNDRLNSSEHEGIEATKKDCNKNGTFITIAFSVLDKNDLERIEACLIYVNKPKHNIQGKDSFNFDKTIVKVSGKRMSGLNEVNTAVRK